jgi:hypothetical protein
MNNILTIGEVTLLADLVRACQGNQRVKWAVDGDVERVTDGVARAFTNAEGNFVGRDTDVRDAFVWISGTFETFMPVRQILALMDQHLFVIAVG